MSALGARRGLASTGEPLLTLGGGIEPDPTLDATSPGRRIWSYVIACMSCVFALESLFLILSSNDESLEVSAEAAAGADANGALTEKELRTAAGLGLLFVAILQLTLTLEILCARHVSTIDRITACNVLFFMSATLQIAFNVMFAIVVCMLEDTGAQPWASGDELPELSEEFKLVMLGVFVQLVVSIVLIIGAVMLKVVEFTSRAMGFALGCEDAEETSQGAIYGSQERLEHMRNYYAQLYRDNGLQVPSQLTPTTSNDSGMSGTASRTSSKSPANANGRSSASAGGGKTGAAADPERRGSSSFAKRK